MNKEIEESISAPVTAEALHRSLSVKSANLFYLIHTVLALGLSAVRIPGLPTTWAPLIYYIPLLGVAYLLCRKEGKAMGPAFGFHRVRPLTVVLTIVTCMAMRSVSHLISSLTNLLFPSFFEASGGQMLGGPFWVSFIGVGLIPAFFEEFVVRGGMLHSLLLPLLLLFKSKRLFQFEKAMECRWPRSQAVVERGDELRQGLHASDEPLDLPALDDASAKETLNRSARQSACFDLISASLILRPVFLAPGAELVQHPHQRVTPFRQAVLDLRRDLRVHLPVNQIVALQFLQRLAEGLVRRASQIPAHLVKAHRLVLHQAVEHNGLIFSRDQRQGIAVTGITEIGF